MDPVLELFDHGVTAAALCSEPFVVSPDADARAAAAALGERGYASAPLDPGPTTSPSAPAPAVVRVFDTGQADSDADAGSGSGAGRAVAARTVAEAARPLEPGALLRPASTFPEVLAALDGHGLVAVVEDVPAGGVRVVGVITARDLDRAVARLAVLGLVLWLEPNLDRLIHARCGGGWPDLLSPSRRQRLGSVRPAVQRPGAGLRSMAVLNLDDRLTLVRRLPELRRDLGWAATGEFRRFAEPLRRVRDSLAHGGGLVDAAGGRAEAVALVQALRALVGRVETLLADGSTAEPLSAGHTPPAVPSPDR